MANEHIIQMLDSFVSVYWEAAILGISVSHIAEFYFETWYREAAKAYRAS